MNVHDYLSARDLAKHYNIEILNPNDVQGFDNLCVNRLKKYDVWSAATISRDTFIAVILNNCHSIVRQESDLFHELAHIICKHEMSGFLQIDGFYLRDYDKEQEEEAERLGGCLHIPRKGLEWAFRRHMSYDEIATHYTASKQMVTYRINITGVKKQYRF